MIVQLITDYGPLGFIPGLSEYSSLVRMLAREPGKELEVLQLLDDVIDVSNIKPFLKLSDKWGRANQLPTAEHIPSEEEIQRIEDAMIKEGHYTPADAASSEYDQSSSAARSEERIIEDEIESEENLSDIENYDKTGSVMDLDRIQRLVVEKRQQRLASKSQNFDGKVVVSRYLFHMAMQGFGQIYHVRGVMEVLNKMLRISTQVPYRIACHLIPDEKTWGIISNVLSHQRDRHTFVKTWIEFLSRGARPPISLTRLLVQMLVRQSLVEQAVWVMRIGRALPDVGNVPPETPKVEDRIPWDLKVQIMYVASALDAATSYDATLMTFTDAISQGKAAARLPLLSPPDLETHARLIGGAVRADNEKLANHLFQELIDANMTPDGATYGYLARLYARKGDIVRVFSIVRNTLLRRYQFLAQKYLSEGVLNTSHEQEKYKRDVKHQTSILKTDVHCLAPLLMLFIQKGSEKGVLALLRSWNNTYGKLISAEKFGLALLKVYSKPEDSAEVNRLLHNALESIRIDHHSDNADNSDASDLIHTMQYTKSSMAAFTDAVRTHIRARNLFGVVNVLRMMVKENLQPPYNLLELAMHGFLNEQALDLFDATHAYFREGLGLPLSLTLYSSWMRTLRNHGDTSGVQAAFDELVELGQIPNQRHYIYLVQAYAFGGWIERAVSIVYNLRKPQSGVHPGLDLNIAVIEAYVACGRLKSAETELHYLLETSPLQHTQIPARPFNYMIIGYLYAGEGSKAMQIYKEIVRLGIKPDVYTFSILMHSYTLANDLENCLRVFNEMLRMGVEPDLVIYIILISAFGARRMVSRAEAVFEQIAREQEWTQLHDRDHVGYRPWQESRVSSSDALSLYAENPQRKDLGEVIDAFDSGKNDISSRLRTHSFCNLDPTVYLAMLKVYNKAKRPLRALATWEGLIHNFPIVQWNPRKGGILSKSLQYTGQFHINSWTVLLRTVRPTFGFHRVVKRLWELSKYFVNPVFSSEMDEILIARQSQKNLIASLCRQATTTPDIDKLSGMMALRAKLIKDIEMEIDERVFHDYMFFAKKRVILPTPIFDVQASSFRNYDYWIPQEMYKSAFSVASSHISQQASVIADRVDTLKKDVASSSKSSLLNENDEFNFMTNRKIAAHVAKLWRQLENDGFKFSNIHVSDYISCILLGRQYDEVIRFLLLVKPPSSSSQASYRYYNLKIVKRASQMLVRLIKVVRQRLLQAKERRIVLEILMDQGGPRCQDYVSECGDIVDPDIERSKNEIQVMRERLALHTEHESGWFYELEKLVEIATIWQRLVSNEEEMEYISNAIFFAETALVRA
ncbi:hypothetical protein IWW48_004523 [Coemansia sp. RSA 1200]|nr:hypothetical protein IWW48_004523 [Coemansia sp. RSA 1200]